MGDPSQPGLADSLARLAVGRDANAWSAIAEAAGGDCWRCCLAVCGNEADASDALQETFMQVRDDAYQFHPVGEDADGDARRWLKRIAITTALQLRRKQVRNRRRDASAPPAQAGNSEPSASLSAQEDLALLRDALADLPEPQRTAIALHHLEGQPLAEVASALGRPLGTVKTWVHRGLIDLRATLSRRGLVIPLATLAALLTGARTQAVEAALPVSLMPQIGSVLHGTGSATIQALSLTAPRMLPMAIKAAALVATLALAVALPWAFSQDTPPIATSTPIANATDRTIEQAAEQGLAWLAAQQQADGSWPNRNSEVGITAIAALALLSGGSTLDQGTYQENLRRACDYLLARTGPDGFIHAPERDASQPYHHTMNHHGMATWCLAELAAGSRDPRITSSLERAVRLTIECQGRSGGWRYLPRPSDGDLPSTANQLRALACAQRVGITVPGETFVAAVAYLNRCAGDTAFAYTEGQSHNPRDAAAWNAAACSALRCVGHGGQRFANGLAQLQQVAWDKPFESRRFFTMFHTALALVHGQGLGQKERELWNSWFGIVTRILILEQGEDGRWQGDSDIDVIGGEQGAYATATAIMILTASHQRLLAMGRPIP